jgi:hypothetical protein
MGVESKGRQNRTKRVWQARKIDWVILTDERLLFVRKGATERSFGLADAKAAVAKSHYFRRGKIVWSILAGFGTAVLLGSGRVRGAGIVAIAVAVGVAFRPWTGILLRSPDSGGALEEQEIQLRSRKEAQALLAQLRA